MSKKTVRVMSLDEMHKAMVSVSAAPGASKKPPAYLPGVHSPASPMRPGKRKLAKKLRLDKGIMASLDIVKPRVKKSDLNTAIMAGMGMVNRDGSKIAPQKPKRVRGEAAAAKRANLRPSTDSQRAAPGATRKSLHECSKCGAMCKAGKMCKCGAMMKSDEIQPPGGMKRRRIRQDDVGTVPNVKPPTLSVAAANLRAGVRKSDDVNKAEASMSNKAYEDIFKSVTSGDDDEKPVIDCPHCDTPITKSEVLAKARGAIPGSVGTKNKEGGHAKDGKSPKKNPRTPKRPGGGIAKQSAPYHGVGKLGKSEAGAGDDGESDVEETDDETETPVKPEDTTQKSLPIVGSGYVYYVNSGADEALAKSIAEGTLGQQPNQPIDRNARNLPIPTR